MSKKYSTTTTLVIVESPAKCKKIEEYILFSPHSNLGNVLELD